MVIYGQVLMSQLSPVHVNCPNESCRAKNRIKLTEEMLGKRKTLRCGACKTEFSVDIPAKVNDGSKSQGRDPIDVLDNLAMLKDFFGGTGGIFH